MQIITNRNLTWVIPGNNIWTSDVTTEEYGSNDAKAMLKTNFAK